MAAQQASGPACVTCLAGITYMFFPLRFFTCVLESEHRLPFLHDEYFNDLIMSSAHRLLV